MMRHISECPTKPPTRNPLKGLQQLEYDITLVTPMFGGGIIPGEADPVTLIRPPTIRGQLRFWWRATCGVGVASTGDLCRRETRVWGNTKNPSPILLEIQLCSRGKIEPYTHSRSGYPPYALFPFQSSERGIPNAVLDARFKLRFSFPAELKNDLQTSVRAWINLGGIGSRTRRGCGTLWSPQLSPPDGKRSEIQEWIKENFAKNMPIASSPAALWPKLGRFWIGPESSSSIASWNEVIKLLRDFRQGVEIGRNSGTDGKRPGRSRWPEAESIRNATGCRSRPHSPAKQIPNEAFPRAEFGMPIVFHFKDSPYKNLRLSPRDLSTFDPADTELHPFVGEDLKTRMASPLILKPLAVNADRAFPFMLLLEVPRPSGVELISGAASIGKFGRSSMRNPTFSDYANSPMGRPRAGMPPRSETGSAIEALVAYAMEKGYTEIRL